MYVYVYMYMCVRICIHIYVNVYIYIYTPIRTYGSIYIYIYWHHSPRRIDNTHKTILDNQHSWVQGLGPRAITTQASVNATELLEIICVDRACTYMQIMADIVCISTCVYVHGYVCICIYTSYVPISLTARALSFFVVL